mgnify:CR=1 FL=1
MQARTGRHAGVIAPLGQRDSRAIASPPRSTIPGDHPLTATTDLRAAPQVGAPEQFVDPVAAAKGVEQQYLDQAKESGQPTEVARANAAAVSPLTEDGRTGLIQWTFDVETVTDVEQTSRDAVTEAVDDARDAGLTVEATGTGMQGMPEMGMTSELIGIAVALVVLVLTFGSLVAAGLPILTALVGVGIGITGITASTAVFDLGTTTPILASMLGLAVGIDYALFILSRYRTELRRTTDREHAIGLAVGRAGSAVVFAGLTVIIALVALAVVNIPFLTAMGLAAAATVLAAVLVALTLLPAVLGALGHRAFAGQIRKDKAVDEGQHVDNGGTRWARAIGARPVLAALVAVLALGALAIPAKDLHLALPSDSTAAPGTSQRDAADLADGVAIVTISTDVAPMTDQGADQLDTLRQVPVPAGTSVGFTGLAAVNADAVAQYLNAQIDAGEDVDAAVAAAQVFRPDLFDAAVSGPVA